MNPYKSYKNQIALIEIHSVHLKVIPKSLFCKSSFDKLSLFPPSLLDQCWSRHKNFCLDLRSRIFHRINASFVKAKLTYESLPHHRNGTFTPFIKFPLSSHIFFSRNCTFQAVVKKLVWQVFLSRKLSTCRHGNDGNCKCSKAYFPVVTFNMS